MLICATQFVGLDTGSGKIAMSLLSCTVQSVLESQLAAADGMQSIAMPLIRHGVAGWPAKLAV